jgi:hypothetical protein
MVDAGLAAQRESAAAKLSVAMQGLGELLIARETLKAMDA